MTEIWIDAEDTEIFRAARKADVVVMSTDSDVLNLLDRHGPPPHLIWGTCGNTSNQRMRAILSETLLSAVEVLEGEEMVVEIGDLSTMYLDDVPHQAPDGAPAARH